MNLQGRKLENDSFSSNSIGSGYGDSSSTKSGILLLLAITCLLLALVMYCLVLVADIAGGTGLGCLLVGATIILGVLGLIFLIMWLVSLKHRFYGLNHIQRPVGQKLVKPW